MIPLAPHENAIFSLFLTTFLVSSVAVKASDMVLRLHDKQIDLSPTRPGGVLHCQKVFQVIRYGSRLSTASPQGVRSGEMHFFRENEIDPRTQKAIAGLFEAYGASGHYQPRDMVMLKARDDALDPLRTKYVEILSEGEVSGIRIFDGSTETLNHGILWNTPAGGRERTPIERVYEFTFPERRFGKRATIWELGLLVAPKHFVNGVESAMANIAFVLDAHYNSMNYRVFKKTDVIQQNDLQIYGVARPKLVPHYRKYGLAPVMVVNSKGEAKPLQFSDGMVLLKVSGEEFIYKNFDRPIHPATLTGGRAEDVSQIIKIEKQLIDFNNKLEAEPVPLIESWQAWLHTWNHVVGVYRQTYYEAPTGSPAKTQAYFDLVRSLYVLLKSPIVDRHDPNVAAKRILIKELLVEGPDFGWQALEQMLFDSRRASEGDYDSTRYQFRF